MHTLNPSHYVNIFDTKGIEYILVMLFLASIYVLVRILATPKKALAAEAVTDAAVEEVSLDPFALPAGSFLAPGHTVSYLSPDGSLALSPGGLPLYMLGDVDRVEIMDKTEVKAGDPIAILHHADRAVELRAPVDGTIEAINADLASHPAALTRAPASQRWMVRLAPKSLKSALSKMFFAKDAQNWLKSEMSRLADLLDDALPEAQGAQTMADGGVPIPGVAAKLEQAQWKKLEERFFQA
ncbi:MAG: hypothetical protein KAI47_06280 [Deltaproteobacteria bacterium]|nr:hypothetical protein [Deltaproteobacteria bacterium]